MNERFFVKPVGHIGQFVLATGELCQNGSLRELPESYQSSRFRSYDEACMNLFGTTDLRVLVYNMQQEGVSLLDRLTAVQKITVLRRAVQDSILPEKTTKNFLGGKVLHNYSDEEADQALAILG